MFNQGLFAQAFAIPGGDPRQWISYGIVAPDAEDSPSVTLKDDDGNPSPYGPIVRVILQPSGNAVPCRVAASVAGDNEGEWYPFLEGDEVLVVIPEGHERAGCAIIGRLNQEIDRWPIAVAGQDATKNTFGFRRMRTPYVVETGASYLIRSAKTGSQIGIDQNGNVLINDGDRGALMIGPEALGFANGDGDAFVNIFPPTKEVYLGADTTTFLLAAETSKFISQGDLTLAVAGGAANQHAVTAEQVAGLIINLLTAMQAAGVFTTGPLAAPNPTLIGTIVAGAIAALAGTAPTSVAPGGAFAGFPTVFGPTGAIAAALANPVAPVDPSGFVPGFGRSGFRY